MKLRNRPLILIALLITLISCKKDSSSMISIIGKWYVTKQTTQLLNSGIVITSFSSSDFTPDDFVQYFTDGSGYFSQRQNFSTLINLIRFNYILSGKTLTVYTGNQATGNQETITSLTLNNLSIHAESLVPDPGNVGQTDNEIADYVYTRAN